MSSRSDIDHFVKLRGRLTALREELERGSRSMRDNERDVVAIATAEALADIAASLNASITVEHV